MWASNNIQVPVELFVAGAGLVIAGLISAMSYIFKKTVELSTIVSTLVERSLDHERRIAFVEGLRAARKEVNGDH